VNWLRDTAAGRDRISQATRPFATTDLVRYKTLLQQTAQILSDARFDSGLQVPLIAKSRIAVSGKQSNPGASQPAFHKLLTTFE